jgi:small subunit ribosomal protein S4e
MRMHMKRYKMPMGWPLAKKANKFVVTPSPGPHPKYNSIPMLIVLRDVLDYANTAAEVKKILSRGEVLVDKKVVRQAKHPIGLMDVIEFPTINKQFRAVAGHKGLELQEIPKKDSSKKLCSIKGKTVIKGGKYKLGLHDGRCIIVGKENKYKPGDSVLIELPTQKILNHWQMKPGVPGMIVAGKNSGVTGKVKDVHNRDNMLIKSGIVLDSEQGEIETLKEYVLVGEIK